MRIALDARLPFYRLGGISQYILHLLPALAKLDHESDYIIFHSRKDNRNYLPVSSNFRRRDLWTPSHHRLERWALAAELVRHRLDLLHSPDFIPPAFGARRRVVTVHDLNFLYYPEYLTADSRRYYLEQINFAVRHADHISADSHQTRRDLIDRLHVPADKVTTIHLAASPIYQQPRSPVAVQRTLRRYDLPDGFLLCVGTLEPRKNLAFLLRVYHELRHLGITDVPLVLVGSKGWLYDRVFATLDELELRPFVRHLEGVTDHELAHLYSRASLLALPSHYEGFGLPVLEAMHACCPVISSNRASLVEVGGPAALLLEPDDTTAWIGAIDRVLHDSELRRQMVEAGRRQAQRFSWSKTAAATLAIYRQVTGERR